MSAKMEELVEVLKLSAEQVKILEDSFKSRRFPHGTELMLVAAECGLSEEDTQNWFQHRNSQWREAEGLPAQRGSLLD